MILNGIRAWVLACVGIIPVESGVSEQLAKERAANISELRYELEFVIPEQKDSCIRTEETISFCSACRRAVILDFREDAGKILSVSVNGRGIRNDNLAGSENQGCEHLNESKLTTRRKPGNMVDKATGKERKRVSRRLVPRRNSYEICNEHIIVPRKFIRKGHNEICINFIAGEQSLNRRDDLMYTLLVPDRARTVFPCFDQPNLKASFQLTLEVPSDWTAVSNTAIESIEPASSAFNTATASIGSTISGKTGNNEATDSKLQKDAGRRNSISSSAGSEDIANKSKANGNSAGSEDIANKSKATGSSAGTEDIANKAKATISHDVRAEEHGNQEAHKETAEAPAGAPAGELCKAPAETSAEAPAGELCKAPAETSAEAPAGKRIKFRPTEPLSTYLFSFVVGRLESYTETRGNQEITLYHQETDPAKIGQCHDIMQLVFDSLDYLEEYTAIPYPFAKYDLIAIPSFQYGGMEHTGATLYNDKRIFLGPDPTTEEILGRASLIAHETAHMWFGDYVTMNWFNDVWTKEVFANWMAAKMVRPQFPQIDHTLADLASYYASAYAEDRTVGSNAIQRPLNNLSNAGLIYCNIIYDKAPVVMEKMAARMGYDRFQMGVRDYLRRFGYSNATWDDLIACLEPYADFDLESWSRVWIKEKGMPEYAATISSSTLSVRQIDRSNKGSRGSSGQIDRSNKGSTVSDGKVRSSASGNIWQQELKYTAIGASGEREELTISFDGQESASASASFEIARLIPNSDGLGYGCFLLSEDEAAELWMELAKMNADCRMATVMNLYENVWRGRTSPKIFVRNAAGAIQQEKEALILSTLITEAADAARMAAANNSQLNTADCKVTAKFQATADSQATTTNQDTAQNQATADSRTGSPEGVLTDALKKIVGDAGQSNELRLLAFRQLYSGSGYGSKSENCKSARCKDTNCKYESNKPEDCQSDTWEDCKDIYAAWESGKAAEGLSLGESDLTAMAYELMVRMPEQYEQIRSAQRERISNPDRLRSFDFVSKAANPDKKSRDEFFRALMEPANRRPESDALAALRLLVHPMREAESIGYIYPALAELPEIQRTGDIFFPASWAKRLLGGRYDAATAAEVRRFLQDYPELDPLLLTKVRQAAGYLLREL